MRPGDGAGAAPDRVGDSAGGRRPAQAPWTPPRHHSAGGYEGFLHHPHMAVHTVENQPADTGHLVVHQNGAPVWLREHITALRSGASTIGGSLIRLDDNPANRPDNTRALNVDQLTPGNPDVRWTPPT